MQPPQRVYTGGSGRFFLINLSHDNLMNYYQTNYQLIEHHKYSLFELESMMPWEREVYVAMLIEDLKQREERRKQQEFRGN